MSRPMDEDDERTVAWAGPDSEDDEEADEAEMPASADPWAGEDRT